MDTNEASVVRASERAPRTRPARPQALVWLGGGVLERALGAALASDPDGEGGRAMRVSGVSVKGGMDKSPRLAPERLQ